MWCDVPPSPSLCPPLPSSASALQQQFGDSVIVCVECPWQACHVSCDCHVIWGQRLLALFSFSCERESALGWGEGDHRHQCGSVEGEGEREEGSTYTCTCT